MSEEKPKEEAKKVEKEDDDEETTTVTKKGILGFNFNDPIVLAATVLGVSVIGIVGWNFIRNFIWAAQPPAPPKQANVTVTPEQLRQAQYQRDLEAASHNLFATNMNSIEETNKQLKNDGVHYYDQFFNQYERKPASITTFEDDIEIVDDNNDIIATVNQKQTYYKPAPPTVQLNKPTYDTRPQKQEIKSQEVINDDEITMITNDEPQLDKIPQEFIAVGNSETAFDKIEAAPQNNETPKQKKQEVDFENLEMDSKVLEQMAAGAYVNPDYY